MKNKIAENVTGVAPHSSESRISSRLCVFFITLLVALAAFVPVLSAGAEADEMTELKSLRSGYKAEDMPLFIGENERETLSPELDTKDDMLSTRSFRIPSLITAADDSVSAVLAFADRGSSGADWGKIDLSMRRSVDSGESWSPLKIILSMPVNTAPQKFEDAGSAFVIDPVSVQAADGSVVVLVDMFPECKGLHNPDILEKTDGYVEIDGEKYLCLLTQGQFFDDIIVNEKSRDKPLSGYDCYTVRENGWIYDRDNKKTNYYVPQNHNPQYNYETLGDVYYAVGTADYIDSFPPMSPKRSDGSASADIYVGNMFLNVDMPELAQGVPEAVEKVYVSPIKQDAMYSSYTTFTTAPAPFRIAITSYLWMLKSRDLGKTWEQPVDITPQVKSENDGYFLGTSPGNGIVLLNQSYTNQINRILMPVYTLGKAAVIYSNDNGDTWQRAQSEYISNVDEAQLVELSNGAILSFGRQDKLGQTPVSYSLDGGSSWKKDGNTGLMSVRCQKSVITLPIYKDSQTVPKGLDVGASYVVACHPSGSFNDNDSRSDGMLTLGKVEEKSHTVEWLYERAIKDSEQYASMAEYSDFFAYSSIALLPNGNIGVLYEAYPQGYIVFTQVDLEWLSSGGMHIAAKTDVSAYITAAFIAVLTLFGLTVVVDIFKGRRISLVSRREYSDIIYAEDMLVRFGEMLEPELEAEAVAEEENEQPDLQYSEAEDGTLVTKKSE